MFGDLTTVTFGFTRGWDVVGKVEHGHRPQHFRADADHRNWTLGISQVLTRNLLLGLNFETDESDGYLHSPYRSVRYVDPTVARGYSYRARGLSRHPHRQCRLGAAQVLPALARRARRQLPLLHRHLGHPRQHRASSATRSRCSRTGPSMAALRYYWQTHANFYSDLFPFENSQNFMARDRELAQFHSITLAAGRELGVSPELAALDRERHAQSRTSTACSSTTMTSATTLVTARSAARRAALHARRDRHAVLYFLLVLNDHPPPRRQSPRRRFMNRHCFLRRCSRIAALAAARSGVWRRAASPTREDARLITATQVLEELRATPDQNVPGWLHAARLRRRGHPGCDQGRVRVRRPLRQRRAERARCRRHVQQSDLHLA